MSGGLCSEIAPRGLLVVHGIGVQQPGETLRAYGGAVARLWTEFGDHGAKYSERECPAGHTHLYCDTQLICIIDEGYWDDLAPEPPTYVALLRWLLLVGPWAMLYTIVRPPRMLGHKASRTGIAIAYYVSLVYWFARLLYGPFLTGVIVLASVAALVVNSGFGSFKRTARIPRVLTMTIADAYLFTSDPLIADAFSIRVSGRARALARQAEKVVVLAHSQGGAITMDALRSPDWPTNADSVIALGSGHKRLHLLRWLAGSPVLAGVGSAAIVLSALLAPVAPYGPPLFMLMLAALLSWPARRTMDEGPKALARKRIDWWDLWGSHDLVPDGPLSRRQQKLATKSRYRNDRVYNERSLIWDHNSYHRNAPDVATRIMEVLWPDRLQHDLDRVQVLRRRRRDRLLGGPTIFHKFWRYTVFGWLASRPHAQTADGIIAQEFLGSE